MPIIQLEQKDAPTHYYNIVPDLPAPLQPPLHPATKQPIGPEDLAAIFPLELIKQEVSLESQIEMISPSYTELVGIWETSAAIF